MAGYTPEHDDYRALVAGVGSQIAATFEDAETRILAEIARRLTRNLPPRPDLADQLRMVQELEAFAARSTEGLDRSLAEQVIAEASAQGAASVLSRLPRLPQVTSLTDQHVLSAALIAFDLGNAYDDMRARILRYPRDAVGQYIAGGDVYQHVIAAHAPQVLLGEATRQARINALQDFLSRGVTGFTDIAGRNWRIGTYTEMATRTAVSRAYTDATVHHSEGLGLDLFTVQGGTNACDHCAPWFGKLIASSGGAGAREVLSAVDDTILTVDVAGTIDDWRASGANHPNCTCLLVPWVPGFPLPVAATGYDPEAHAARDRLRELEVRERDAKRKLTIATAAGDTNRVNKQQRRILATQHEIREHVAVTGQRRRYERSQPKFADGISEVGAREVVLRRVDAASRVAPFVPEGLPLHPHELDTASRLADVGLRVRFRELDNQPGAKNLDVTIDSMAWELKSPVGRGASTISNQLHRAKEQGATRVVIDTARTPLDDAAVLDEMRRRFSHVKWWESMIHIAHDGTVTRISR